MYVQGLTISGSSAYPYIAQYNIGLLAAEVGMTNYLQTQSWPQLCRKFRNTIGLSQKKSFSIPLEANAQSVDQRFINWHTRQFDEDQNVRAAFWPPLTENMVLCQEYF